MLASIMASVLVHSCIFGWCCKPTSYWVWCRNT